MTYKIYELVKPEVLKRLVREGYSTVTKELIVLDEMGYDSGVDDCYSSEAEAHSAIINNKEELKHKDLIIMPVVSVGWDGEVS